MFQKFQHFSRMRTGICHGNPMLLDRAIRTDKSSRPDRTLGYFSLSVFTRPPGAVGFHRFFLCI